MFSLLPCKLEFCWTRIFVVNNPHVPHIIQLIYEVFPVFIQISLQVAKSTIFNEYQ